MIQLSYPAAKEGAPADGADYTFDCGGEKSDIIKGGRCCSFAALTLLSCRDGMSLSEEALAFFVKKKNYI